MYSTKNTLKVMVSPFTGESAQAALADLPVGEIGFYDNAGDIIAAGGTGSFYFKKADGTVIKSKEMTFVASPWAGITSYAAPTMEVQTVTVPSAVAGDLYQLRVEMKIPYMQGEYIKHGNHKAITGDTTSTIATALAASINAGLSREEKTYFTIAGSTADVVITQLAQPYVKAKKQGAPIAFKASLPHPQDTAVLSVLTTPGAPGIGYGPIIAEKEMFAQGDHDSYRFNNWPNSFDWSSLEADAAGEYDVLVISDDGVIKTAMDLVTANQDYLICFNSAGSAPAV